MENQTDFNTRKMGVDVVYTLSKIHPLTLKPYKKELNDVIGELRFDKIKPVREAAIEALNSFKDNPDLEVTDTER